MYAAEDYEERGEECARLANLTKDELIRKELLILRQNYLQTAERLRQIEASGKWKKPE